MKTEKEPMLAGQEKAPSVLLLNDHIELILDGTLYRVSCEFSDSGHLPDLLDTLILQFCRIYRDLSLRQPSIRMSFFMRGCLSSIFEREVCSNSVLPGIMSQSLIPAFKGVISFEGWYYEDC